MEINSVNNKRIKEICKLKEKKYKDITGLFLVEGEHLIYEAYKQGLLKEVFVLSGEDFDIDAPVNYVSREVMKKITSLDTISNVIGICSKKKEEKIGKRLLILDDIQDPGNLGTIIRSAVAFNVNTIVLSKNTVDLYNSKVIRATQGMIFNINIITRDIKDFIINLKKDNYTIYGTNVSGGTNIKDITVEDKYALIIGNEGSGIKKEISDLCDSNLYIKLNEGVESLNAAVACSILLYEMDNKNAVN